MVVCRRCWDAFRTEKQVKVAFTGKGMLDSGGIVVGDYLLFKKQGVQAVDGRGVTSGPLGRW